MNETEFWNLLEEAREFPTISAKRGLLARLFSRSKPDDGQKAFLSRLQGLLAKLPPAEIMQFKLRQDEQMDRAYTWNLWGAAYVIMGGCSDDGFEYWRAWLMSKGRAVFDSAVANPESLAQIDLGNPEAMEFEELLYVAPAAYEETTGNDLYAVMTSRSRPSDPTGEPWEEDTGALASRFPKLSAKYG